MKLIDMLEEIKLRLEEPNSLRREWRETLLKCKELLEREIEKKLNSITDFQSR